MAARSGNLFRPYAAVVSCLGSNSTRVMRPKISISAITLPAFVTASTTAELSKRVSSLGDENRSTRREPLSVFALFDLASFRVMNAGSPGIIELHVDFGEIDRFYNRGMCVTDLRMAKTLWPSRSSFFWL
jgi:hypothetical protein